MKTQILVRCSAPSNYAHVTNRVSRSEGAATAEGGHHESHTARRLSASTLTPQRRGRGHPVFAVERIVAQRNSSVTAFLEAIRLLRDAQKLIF